MTHRYLRLLRLDKPIGILLLLWPTLWGLWFAAGGLPPMNVLLIFTVGVVLMRSAGCAINDYADRDFDAHVERTRQRPLATGEVTRREALFLAGGLAADFAA
jgi:4-hydroxybenzoate polyprenyltransferase